MADQTHLNALEIRLSHERDRMRKAKSDDEKALRGGWITQIEKEIADERKHLGLAELQENDISDDELLGALAA